MISLIKTLSREESGAAVMEFGLVIPVLMLMLMGFYDAGHGIYVRSVLQGAVEKAARDGTLEGGAANAATLDAAVEAQVRPIAGKDAVFQPGVRKSYANFSKVGQGETYTDTNHNGVRDSGECFQDENGNHTYDADVGLDGQGTASDVVLYTKTVTYPRLFPMNKLLGWSNNITLSGSTVLRNQPYGDQTTYSVTTICT